MPILSRCGHQHLPSANSYFVVYAGTHDAPLGADTPTPAPDRSGPVILSDALQLALGKSRHLRAASIYNSRFRMSSAPTGRERKGLHSPV